MGKKPKPDVDHGDYAVESYVPDVAMTDDELILHRASRKRSLLNNTQLFETASDLQSLGWTVTPPPGAAAMSSKPTRRYKAPFPCPVCGGKLRVYDTDTTDEFVTRYLRCKDDDCPGRKQHVVPRNS